MTDLRRRIAFPKGTVLFQPGQACPGLVLLDKGTIKVTLTAANGREVVLYRVSPGDMCLQTFSCLVEGRTYSAEGVAETDLEGDKALLRSSEELRSSATRSRSML